MLWVGLTANLCFYEVFRDVTDVTDMYVRVN